MGCIEKTESKVNWNEWDDNINAYICHELIHMQNLKKIKIKHPKLSVIKVGNKIAITRA